jgi:hypothetical protein
VLYWYFSVKRFKNEVRVFAFNSEENLQGVFGAEASRNLTLSFLLREGVKILALFCAGLYLLGFVWFPLLGIGNYELVRADFLLPSELALLSVLSLGLIGWSFKVFAGLVRKVYS